MQIHDLILLGLIREINFKLLLFQVNWCEDVKMLLEILYGFIEESGSVGNTLAKPVIGVFHISEIVVLAILATLD